MGVKNHSGVVSRITTWENSRQEMEIKLYDERNFLWHFCQDDSTDTLEEGKFYSPVWEKMENGRRIRKSRHLFYVLIPRDDSGDCVFIEIGPDGFVNRTYQDADRLETDIQQGVLLPLWLVSTFGKPPEETINVLKKYKQ